MSHRHVGAAALPQTPAHMPVALQGDAFSSLYADFQPHSLRVIDADQQRRIRSGRSAEEIYRELPTAPDFEYSGYLTKTRVRYAVGRAFDCDDFHDKPCAFHTHPTEHPNADLPSLQDLYGFLRSPVRRSITIGGQWLWWWDKRPSILPVVNQLLTWEAEHMVATMIECSRNAKPGERFRSHYLALALEQVGLRQQLVGDVPQWTADLQRALGLETSYCRR